ncbi:MAG: carbonic anhydrase [Alphaproteobacteria bacterium]|nr:carbonic anhydrase [Alphaproteobacteria bacterium]
MPEHQRDLELTEFLRVRIAEIRDAADTFRKEHSDFILRFPEEVRRFIPHLSFGQALTEEAFKTYEEETGHSLSEGQHPTEALISASHFTGNPSHIFGDNGAKDIGHALVFRVLNSLIQHQDGSLRYEAQTFTSLAVDLKGLTTIYDAKTSASEVFTSAYLYHKYNGNQTLIRAALYHDEETKKFINDPEETITFMNDPNILGIILRKKDLYNTVVGNGFKYYENLLVIDEEDRKRVDAAVGGQERGFPETIDERYIRAMTLEQVLQDRDALMESDHSPDNIVTIYQSAVSKREFVWNGKKFVVIPEKDEDNPLFEKEKERFFKKIPKNGAWRKIRETLIRGAREYRKTMALKELTDDLGTIIRAYVISCSDSRAHSLAILGPRADSLRYNLRNPGATISRLGEMTSDGARFYAIARKHKKAVILTGHSNCGAMTAIDAYLSEKTKDLPKPFQELGRHRENLYKNVKNKGVAVSPHENKNEEPLKSYSDEEIILHYANTYGLPISSIADCLSIQQVMDDYAVARRDYPDVTTAVVFQNMIEAIPQNYLLNTNSMRFEAIPTGKDYLPSRNKIGSSCRCGCISSAFQLGCGPN